LKSSRLKLPVPPYQADLEGASRINQVFMQVHGFSGDCSWFIVPDQEKSDQDLTGVEICR
jgi:hypothetical protein